MKVKYSEFVFINKFCNKHHIITYTYYKFKHFLQIYSCLLLYLKLLRSCIVDLVVDSTKIKLLNTSANVINGCHQHCTITEPWRENLAIAPS